jgi:hypothetical protein
MFGLRSVRSFNLAAREGDEMTATPLRYRRYHNRTRSIYAIAEFFREYPRFSDCEFNFSGNSVTIFAKRARPLK